MSQVFDKPMPVVKSSIESWFEKKVDCLVREGGIHTWIHPYSPQFQDDIDLLRFP